YPVALQSSEGANEPPSTNIRFGHTERHRVHAMPQSTRRVAESSRSGHLRHALEGAASGSGKMRRSDRWIAGAIIAFCPLAADAQAISEPMPWEAWNDIRQVALVGGNHDSYLASSYCLDGCRYDRT